MKKTKKTSENTGHTDKVLQKKWGDVKTEKEKIEKKLDQITGSIKDLSGHKEKIEKIKDNKKRKHKHGEEIDSWIKGEKGIKTREDPTIKDIRRMSTTTLYVTYILLVSAELMMLYDVGLGIIIHSVTLLGLAAGSTTAYKRQINLEHKLSNKYIDAANLLKALMLLPLIRIFAFTMPLMFFRKIYWFLLISIPMLIAVIILSRNLKLKKEEIGLIWGKPGIQIPVILCGILFGFTEYLLLKPAPMIDSLNLVNILVPAIILITFTGFTEELIFRGIIQTISTKIFGAVNGILYTSIIFTAMHVGFNSMPHMLFVLLVSIFYGTVFYKTKALSGVILSHGLSNVILLLVAPFVI